MNGRRPDVAAVDALPPPFTGVNLMGTAMRAFHVVALLLALSACKEDGTKAIPKPTETLTVTMTIVPDPAEMQRLREQFGKGDRVNGFATWFVAPNGDIAGCRIYVPPILTPSDWAAVETLMHEVGHCVAGAWHN